MSDANFNTAYTPGECDPATYEVLTPWKVCFKLEFDCPTPSTEPATLPEPVCVDDSLVVPSVEEYRFGLYDSDGDGSWSSSEFSAYTAVFGGTGSFDALAGNDGRMTLAAFQTYAGGSSAGQGCEFVTASISQSNPYPCHLNTMTVTFSTSTQMKKGTKVTIEGLTGTNTESTTAMRIVNIPPASGDSGQLEAMAEWDQTAGILVVVLAQDMPASLPSYILTFEITNPSGEGAGKSTRLLRGAATLKIYADDICKASSQMQNDESKCLFSDSQIYGARPGDAAPLVVLRPKMLTKKFGQTSPFAGCVSFRCCHVFAKHACTVCARVHVRTCLYDTFSFADQHDLGDDRHLDSAHPCVCYGHFVWLLPHDRDLRDHQVGRYAGHGSCNSVWPDPHRDCALSKPWQVCGEEGSEFRLDLYY